MRIIGVTGGVGAGKSTILQYLTTNYNSRVLKADSIAHMLMGRGQRCYEELGDTFGTAIFDENLNIDKQKLADIIFSNEEDRQKVNRIVHPAVKQYIKSEIQKEEALNEVEIIVIEAALLLEDHYEEVCDELWYIYSSRESRIKRLKSTRGYSDEKIDGIFKSQMSEEFFRKKCTVIIDNDSSLEKTYIQIDNQLKHRGGIQVIETEGIAKQLIFGLDIGTRNVVGTVGYKDDDEIFHVVAQFVKEHDTRAMLDGQIHDITKVGKTVNVVKTKLEEQIGQKLTEVCIAAAGRVLKTVTTHIDYEFPEETVVLGENIHALDLLGIEKAQNLLLENNDTKFRFYCVGYTVVKYYLNDDIISNLESHKAEKISEDLIVTFLPEDVVDGLYAAVGMAGLEVLNLTLEPIAAINVAIPEAYRMLNIALIDVGAGTSDISITRDGSIVAYGMIPYAGDEISELIVQHYLVDFKTAEHIKLESGEEGKITYKDIMCISHDIEPEEVWDLTKETVEKITKEVSEKIIELNGGNSVSACFIVGGGGKIHGFTENIAKELELPNERVALRGEEVLQEVDFLQEDIKKDPLIVTPIGICLSYYEQKNSFIFIHFNGERIKLYNNNKLTIVDAAIEAGFPNEYLFPRRGEELNFTVNGKTRIIRGELGESSVVKIDGKVVSLSTPLENNNRVEIQKSTEGEPAKYTIEQLPEYNTTITFVVNGREVSCQRFVEVNGQLESPYYEINSGDSVIMRNYYTVEQIIEFMDVSVNYEGVIYVNNKSVDVDEKVYENFNVEFSINSYSDSEIDLEKNKAEKISDSEAEEQDLDAGTENIEEGVSFQTTDATLDNIEEDEAGKEKFLSITVIVNGEPVELKGKTQYVYVDIFDHINFNLTEARGRSIVTQINGENCAYNDIINDGDKIDIFWE